MADPALNSPNMPGPQPVEKNTLRRAPSCQTVLSPLLSDSRYEIGDPIFKFAMLACALTILALLSLIVYELMFRPAMSWHAFGFGFFVGSNWDPVQEQFGALPFIYGTLVSSLLALLIAVPLAVGVAVFTSELCPPVLRAPLASFTELLAAIPSVIYGLWAIFGLVTILPNYVQPLLARTLGWTTLFQGAPSRYGMLAAGILLP